MDDNAWAFWGSTLVAVCKFGLLAGTAVYAHFRLTSSLFELVLMSITILIVFKDMLVSLDQIYKKHLVSLTPSR